jgi:putative tricarboxylic transport membrane protein
VFAFLGAYAANASVADLIIMSVIGLIGYAMRLYEFPMAPVLVGMILGPLSEQQLRRALALSQGDPLVFLTRPISAPLLALAVAILVLPPLAARFRKARAARPRRGAPRDGSGPPPRSSTGEGTTGDRR